MTAINEFIWGIPMPVLLLGTHLFMTVRTGFIQRRLPLALRLSLAKDSNSDGDISPFAALSTALASTLGTGNIIGVGTAIALGGPGAVFWCWLTGVFGMATSYAEAFIALKYRIRTKDGRTLGGAMYALERGLHMKGMAVLFACFGVLASFGIGCGVQVNAIAETADTAVKQAVSGSGSFLEELLVRRPDAVRLSIGILTGLITCLVILGGIRSISKVCEILVPFMAASYLAGCVLILFMNRSFLDDALLLILKSAFVRTDSVIGGLTGSGIMLAARYGISRGLFSNEAGMGSAPLIAAAARSQSPARQALIASTATFWDTVVMCLVSGLVIVSSLLSGGIPSDINFSGGELTALAFARIPHIGTPLLLFSIITFAYATILGWSYYGERCLEYLFGSRSFFAYRFLWILVLVFAPVLELELIWNISDTLNALMAIPNLTAVLLLSGEIAKESRNL
jgi:AGCS family alanine or glycine:cation symporter